MAAGHEGGKRRKRRARKRRAQKRFKKSRNWREGSSEEADGQVSPKLK